jgi:hypothetical protein
LTLKLFSSAKKELEGLNDKSQAIEGKMIASQHRFFIDSSGLRPFLDILTSETQEVSHVGSCTKFFIDSVVQTSAVFHGKSRKTIANPGIFSP